MLERTCVACGRKAAKRELLRVSRDAGGAFVIDARQNQPGRGAYVCPTFACAELLLRKRGLHHSFRQEVPAEVYQRLLTLVKNNTATNNIVSD